MSIETNRKGKGLILYGIIVYLTLFISAMIIKIMRMSPQNIFFIILGLVVALLGIWYLFRFIKKVLNDRSN